MIRATGFHHGEEVTVVNGMEFPVKILLELLCPLIDLHSPYYREETYENWSSMSLTGEIRPSLMDLKSLRYLDLSGNSFEYIPIPKFIGSLKNLQYLNLAYCGFSGAIPPSLGNLSNLQFLDLSVGHDIAMP